MTIFRVWAPDATSLDVQVRGGDRVPMARASGGWWAADVPSADPGTDYAYALDGGEPLPDPRSPWQPEGIFGPSRAVDHAAFVWHDQGWQAPPLSAALIYELHVGTFTPEGTFDSTIGRLDHLAELGVTHVELMPIVEFPGARGWGYDGADLFAPHHAYGGPDGLKRLVDAAHARGLAVLLDVVYNHFGPSGSFAPRFGPYLTDRYRTPWGRALNLDGAHSDKVRRFVVDNALMWLRDYHADGLRLDAVHAILDQSALHILEEIARAVRELGAHLGRHLVVIAESDLNNPRLVRSWDAGGYGLDAQWSDDFRHALHTVLTGESDGFLADFGSLEDLAHAFENGYVYEGRYSAYRKRRHGRPAPDLLGHRLLGYLQNHDQIGNRAGGERSAALMPPGRLKLAAALVLTAPFVPLLFQGEEWGASTPFLFFTDHDDPEVARAVSEGRKREFGGFGWEPDRFPDPQDPRTFERSKLDWDELARGPHAAMYDWHRRLLRLRRASPALTDGRLDRVRARFDEDARWLVVERSPLSIACNLAGGRQRVPLPGGLERTLLLASEPSVELVHDGVELPPDSVAIVERPEDESPG